jgi:hypothetical protein
LIGLRAVLRLLRLGRLCLRGGLGGVLRLALLDLPRQGGAELVAVGAGILALRRIRRGGAGYLDR